MITIDDLEARNYDRGMWLLERFSLTRLRHRIIREAGGAVLEIGAGTGANLPYYQPGTTVAVMDMRPAHLATAIAKAHRTNPTLNVAAACGDAQRLPFPDQAFDSVVGTLVFCSIHDPLAALSEIRRVLRPNGQLLLLEHVRGQTPLTRRLTDWLHPLWFALQGECHLNRETAVAVADAGFRVDSTTNHARGLIQLIRATAPPL